MIQSVSIPRIVPSVWTLAALFAALFAYAFRAPIVWMVDRWNAPESYYSHGWFVPFVALWFVWRDRQGLMDAWTAAGASGRWNAREWGLGLVCFVGGALALFLSGWLGIYFAAALGFVLGVWGLCGFLFGRRVMRRLTLAAALLFFMVPMPLKLIADISLGMKLFAGEVALRGIDLLGIPAVSDGSTLLVGDAIVTVGNACSGLRSLISLLFLGLVFAALAPLRPSGKVLLFVAAIPIAILANVARVFGLCLIAYRWGGEAIDGAVHDVSGYMIFVVALLLLWGVLAVLERAGLRIADRGFRISDLKKGLTTEGTEITERAEELDPQSVVHNPQLESSQSPGNADLPIGISSNPKSEIRNPKSAARRLNTRVIIALAILGFTATVSAFALYQERMVRGSETAERLPMEIGGWIGVRVPVEEYVKRILETDDVIQRDYTHPSHRGRPVQMAVVYSADNRRVAHPPEVCYRGSGWEVHEKVVIHPPNAPPLVRLRVSHGSANSEIVLYCYKSGETITANYSGQQWQSILNQLRRKTRATALLRFSTPIAEGETAEAAEGRALEFVRAMMPEVRKTLGE